VDLKAFVDFDHHRYRHTERLRFETLKKLMEEYKDPEALHKAILDNVDL
jgi:hypothetical protein